MVERRREAAAATTAADDCDAGLAAATMGALAAAPLPADLATVPPERQEREAAIWRRRRREMVREGVRKQKKEILREKKVDKRKRFRRLSFCHSSHSLSLASRSGRGRRIAFSFLSSLTFSCDVLLHEEAHGQELHRACVCFGKRLAEEAGTDAKIGEAKSLSIENQKNSTHSFDPRPPPSLNRSLYQTEPRRLGHRRGHRLRRMGPTGAAEGAREGGGKSPSEAGSSGERPEFEAREQQREQRPRFADSGPADRRLECREQEDVDRLEMHRGEFCKMIH